MRNYIEKGILCEMAMCKALVLILGMRKQMRMILENMMRRLGRKRILNNMKREINELMGVDMMMPNIVATLAWPSVGVKPNTWKSWGFGVLRDSRMFRARQQGAKHLALGCS
jgi:hypothetical protein